MNWLITRNNKPVNIYDIPCLDILKLRDEIINQCNNDKRIILFFGSKYNENLNLYVILADDDNSELLIAKSDITNVSSYPSITNEIQSFHVYERELWEDFGIIPDGHPWLKPIRYSEDRANKSLTMGNYPFFSMSGEGIHEVAVGPVHAGVIEPGHFRFMCEGELVHHLEIQLGYQHRNVEKLFLDTNNPMPFKPHLAESICGDSVIAYVTAYANAMEALCGIDISKKAELIRAIALELERIAIHIGDLGAICNDVAYLTGNSVFGARRTIVINTLLSICGSRFGRGLIRVGGVQFDIDSELIDKIKVNITNVLNDVTDMSEIMFSSAGVLSRLQKTGIVSYETAKQIGMIGLAAKASGISLDVRVDHPFGAYLHYPIHKLTLDSGDVFARSYIRYAEIKQSSNFIFDILDELNIYDNEIFMTPKALTNNKLVISLVEGWRGEVAHAVLTNDIGKVIRYKIKDPSFNNWYGLAMAVRNNGISDFPLCNKSFNLSYCGNDL